MTGKINNIKRKYCLYRKFLNSNKVMITKTKKQTNKRTCFAEINATK